MDISAPTPPPLARGGKAGLQLAAMHLLDAARVRPQRAHRAPPNVPEGVVRWVDAALQVHSCEQSAAYWVVTNLPLYPEGVQEPTAGREGPGPWVAPPARSPPCGTPITGGRVVLQVESPHLDSPLPVPDTPLHETENFYLELT